MAQSILRPQMTAARLNRFNRAWQRPDLGELRRFLDPEVVYRPLSGERVRGPDAVAHRVAQGLANRDRTEIQFEPPILEGSRGACRWRVSGRTADGAAYEIEGIDIYEFAGDRIRSKDAYQKA